MRCPNTAGYMTVIMISICHTRGLPSAAPGAQGKAEHLPGHSVGVLKGGHVAERHPDGTCAGAALA